MTKRSAIATAAAILLLGSPLAAKKYEPTLPGQAVVLAGETMQVQVVVDQDVIATNVDIGRVAPSVSGGGLIGALIIAGKDRDRKREHIALAEERADANAAPIRNALADFDVLALADAATAQAFPGASIVGGGNGAGNKPSVIAYSYGLSPDFTQVRVTADLAIIPTAGSPTVMRQRITSIVELDERSYDDDDNAERWAQDDGARARHALETAFARLAETMPKLMAMDAGTFASLTHKGKPKAFLAGFYGPVVIEDEGGKVIWTPQGAVASQKL